MCVASWRSTNTRASRFPASRDTLSGEPAASKQLRSFSVSHSDTFWWKIPARIVMSNSRKGSSGLTVEVSAVFGMPSRKLTLRRPLDQDADDAGEGGPRTPPTACAAPRPSGYGLLGEASPDILEYLENCRRGFPNPRVKRRSRVKPVTAKRFRRVGPGSGRHSPDTLRACRRAP